jgi:hypothetical protein
MCRDQTFVGHISQGVQMAIKDKLPAGSQLGLALRMLEPTLS